MEVSIVAEAKESKTVEVKNQAHADCGLRRERNRPHGVLCHRVSMSIKRSSFSAQEEARVVAGQRMAASPGQQGPAHNALSIRQFLTERNVTVLDHPPYSPDLAPCDIFLFPKLKEVIKGVRFLDVEAIKKVVTTELKRIPEESFQECMETW